MPWPQPRPHRAGSGRAPASGGHLPRRGRSQGRAWPSSFAAPSVTPPLSRVGRLWYPGGRDRRRRVPRESAARPAPGRHGPPRQVPHRPRARRGRDGGGLRGDAPQRDAGRRSRCSTASSRALPSMRARFLREGYVANKVGHPGAVRVLDDDVAEDGVGVPGDGAARGRDARVADRRARGRRLPRREVAALGHELLDVLAAAHAQGIVHRDIKPENLFLTTRRARSRCSTSASPGCEDGLGAPPPRTGATLGTPAFMPPEQALGRSGGDRRAHRRVVGGGHALHAALREHRARRARPPPRSSSARATVPARSLADGRPGRRRRSSR